MNQGLIVLGPRLIRGFTIFKVVFDHYKSGVYRKIRHWIELKVWFDFKLFCWHSPTNSLHSTLKPIFPLLPHRKKENPIQIKNFSRTQFYFYLLNFPNFFIIRKIQYFLFFKHFFILEIIFSSKLIKDNIMIKFFPVWHENWSPEVKFLLILESFLKDFFEEKLTEF